MMRSKNDSGSAKKPPRSGRNYSFKGGGFRYLEIVDDIAKLIINGTLRPGDPIPSIRLAALQRKVSKGTVVQAYGELEARLLIEARPQSGFYVRAFMPRVSQLPEVGLARPAILRPEPHEKMLNTLGDLIGARVTSLGSSFVDPSLFPMSDLNRAMTSSLKKSGYANTLVDVQLGLPSLRRAISQRYLETGYTVPIEEIIITCGGMEAISLSLQAITKPGDLVLIDSPMFFSGLEILKQLGLGTVEMPTDPQEGLDLNLLDKTLSKHKVSACLLMTNCQNPLGFSMEEEKKRRLIEILSFHDVPLVENDVYAELQFGDRQKRAAKAFDIDGSILHCSSFTKALAPGYKIGWVAAGRYKDAIANRKFATTLGTSMPPQSGIAHYLQHYSYERHLRKLRQTIEERMAQMILAINKYFPVETRISRPMGGFVLWVQLPANVSSLKLYEIAASRDVGIAPGPIFSAKQAYSNFIRLNSSHPWSSSLEKTIQWIGHQVGEMA